MNLSNGDKQITQAHYLFMQQCMMGAMNEIWLVAARMHCNMLYKFKHCWDSQADSWCLCVPTYFFYFILEVPLFTFYWFDHFDFIEKAKKAIFYNGSTATIHKVNLIHKFRSKWLCLKHNQYHQITCSIWSSDCYNSSTAAKHNLKLIMWGSGAQLNQNTDHHNGDLILFFLLLQWFCLLTPGVFNNAQSSLNYLLNYLINFNTVSVFI